MPYLLDKNIVLRFSFASDPEHLLVVAAVDRLINNGDVLRITPQNFIEFWSVATRATQYNGFGLDPTQVSQEIERLKGFFPLAEDVPAIFPYWEQLVFSTKVIGRQVYDARLVAVMLTHNIDTILTFNVSDFTRYGMIQAVHPKDV